MPHEPVPVKNGINEPLGAPVNLTGLQWERALTVVAASM